MLSGDAMLRYLAALAALALVVACSGASDARPPSQAQPIFDGIVKEMVVGDERLFLFTADALVSIPKAGGAPITISPLVEPLDTVHTKQLARGGAFVVAALDLQGPVIVVDQQTSQLVASWQPPADFGAPFWHISSVATDGERVFLGIVDANGTSIVALPATTLAGTPQPLVRHANIVALGGPGEHTEDAFAVIDIVADGASVFYAYSQGHFTYGCPTCGGVVGSARELLVRLTGDSSTNLYEGSIGQIALGDDAVWVLQASVERTTKVKRVPKNGNPVGTFTIGSTGHLAAAGKSAFVPGDFGSSGYDGIWAVNADDMTRLRAPANVYALAVDDSFVYASIVVDVDNCPSGGKGCLGSRRVVYTGVDRMPRAH